MFFDKQRKLVLQAARAGDVPLDLGDNELRRILTRYLAEAALDAVDEALLPLLSFGLGFDRNLLDEAAIAFARSYVSDFAYSEGDGGLAALLQSTTRQQVQEKVARWLAEGDKIDELIADLEPTFGADRAETIAVTEVTSAYAGSRVQTWREINRQLGREVIVGKRWQTANDERVCPICAPLGGLDFDYVGARPASRERQKREAQTAGLGDAFVHPGGSGLARHFEGMTYIRPPAHPRCRCTLLPVINYE